MMIATNRSPSNRTTHPAFPFSQLPCSSNALHPSGSKSASILDISGLRRFNYEILLYQTRQHHYHIHHSTQTLPSYRSFHLPRHHKSILHDYSCSCVSYLSIYDSCVTSLISNKNSNNNTNTHFDPSTKGIWHQKQNIFYFDLRLLYYA